MRWSTLVAIVALGCLAAPGEAQWLDHPAKGIPRTADGKPNLTAPTPRTSGGRPDLSGIWRTDGTPPEEMLKLFPGIGDFVVPGDDNPTRTIHMDGRALPAEPNPAWVGYSVGRWDGDTLVVETTGFTDRSWLDGVGNPRSEQMKITERMTRRDFGHLETQVTFDDSALYTRPFSIRYTQTLAPDTDLLEYVCNENELDRAHIVPPR